MQGTEPEIVIASLPHSDELRLWCSSLRIAYSGKRQDSFQAIESSERSIMPFSAIRRNPERDGNLQI
jgi:hypothetical protein